MSWLVDGSTRCRQRDCQPLPPPILARSYRGVLSKIAADRKYSCRSLTIPSPTLLTGCFCGSRLGNRPDSEPQQSSCASEVLLAKGAPIPDRGSEKIDVSFGDFGAGSSNQLRSIRRKLQVANPLLPRTTTSGGMGIVLIAEKS